VSDAQVPEELVAVRWFNRTLLAVITLTFVTLILWVALALAIPDPTPSETGLIEGVSRTFTACVGAILGLLGGKAS
jgi:hypothetical protein